MPDARRFKAKVARSGSKAWIEIPFDPDEAWGAKTRHYVQGMIDGHRIRGLLSSAGMSASLPLGPAWRRDNPLPDNAIEVVLEPDGPQAETLADDIVDALSGAPAARAFFESVAPFYRKNFLRWIDQAKRPETRQARISEMLRMLEAGQLRG